MGLKENLRLAFCEKIWKTETNKMQLICYHCPTQPEVEIAETTLLKFVREDCPNCKKIEEIFKQYKQ